MTPPDMRAQTRDTYRRMAVAANHRPAAPSDDCGRLDLQAEADRYATQWLRDEDAQTYWAGCPDHQDRPALVLIVEAARCLNGMDARAAARLLRMALQELEARS